jgi:hypothetical protein
MILCFRYWLWPGLREYCLCLIIPPISPGTVSYSFPGLFDIDSAGHHINNSIPKHKKFVNMSNKLAYDYIEGKMARPCITWRTPGLLRERHLERKDLAKDEARGSSNCKQIFRYIHGLNRCTDPKLNVRNWKRAGSLRGAYAHH